MVKVAASDAAKARAADTEAAKAPPSAALVETASASPEEPPGSAQAPVPPPPIAEAANATGGVAGVWGASTSNVKKWLHVGGEGEPAKPEATAYVPDQPIPSDVPLPPRRSAGLGEGKTQHVAQKAPAPPAKPADAAKDSADAQGATGAIPAAPAPAAAN